MGHADPALPAPEGGVPRQDSDLLPHPRGRHRAGDDQRRGRAAGGTAARSVADRPGAAATRGYGGEGAIGGGLSPGAVLRRAGDLPTDQGDPERSAGPTAPPRTAAA